MQPLPSPQTCTDAFNPQTCTDAFTPHLPFRRYTYTRTPTGLDLCDLGLARACTATGLDL